MNAVNDRVFWQVWNLRPANRVPVHKVSSRELHHPSFRINKVKV